MQISSAGRRLCGEQLGALGPIIAYHAPGSGSGCTGGHCALRACLVYLHYLPCTLRGLLRTASEAPGYACWCEQLSNSQLASHLPLAFVA